MEDPMHVIATGKWCGKTASVKQTGVFQRLMIEDIFVLSWRNVRDCFDGTRNDWQI